MATAKIKLSHSIFRSSQPAAVVSCQARTAFGSQSRTSTSLIVNQQALAQSRSRVVHCVSTPRLHWRNSSTSMPLFDAEPKRILFSTFDVTKQTFYTSRDLRCAAIVNLKPIVPGHVLVIPTTPYHRLSEVPKDELVSLFLSVQEISRGLEHIFGADAMTVSIQDGEAAGQTVPHLHVHILPRKLGDIVPQDRIYEFLQEWGYDPARPKQSEGRVDADENRKPREQIHMHSEAGYLAQFFDNDGHFDASRLTSTRK